MRAVCIGLAVLGLWAAPVRAGCAAGQELFLRCDIAGDGKAVELCHDERKLSYRFGPKGGAPELALSLRFGEGAEHEPWPGIGRTIWEAMRLRNNDVLYEVYAGFDKIDAVEPGPPDGLFGGIVVHRDGVGEIAHLRCRAGTVEYVY